MSDSWAPALAHTAPPTVPGIASPNSRPVSPAFCVSVAARAIGDARVGGVALALDARSLGPILDDQAADAAVADHEVAAATQDQMWERARAGEAHERPQLEQVVDGREEVRRSADTHRREPRQRLVARRLDPDPTLDLGSDGDRVERRHRGHPRPAARSALDRRRVGQRLRGGPPPARDRRPRRRRPADRATRAAADIARCAAGSSSRRAASSRAAASKAASSIEPAGAGLDELASVGRLVTGRMRVRHDHDRQAQGGHLGERRRARLARPRDRRRPARSACRRAGTGCGR